MQIERVVYTKVGREESPWNLADFHTVFYPVGLLSTGKLASLEKRIHVPDLRRIPQKKTLFFESINQKEYLILFFLKSLPDDRDSFGRGGIIIMQGFLFPPAVWQCIFTPLELVALTEQHLFKDREELLASPLVDRKTGNIKPVEISERKLAELGKSSLNLPGTGKKIVQQLINMGRGAKASLLLKGDPEQVFGTMTNLFPVVPDQLKTALGWDDAYENANLNLFPLSIAGFMDGKPIAANAVVLNTADLTITQQPEGDIFLPETPYQHWLEERSSTVFEKSMIEAAWQLSMVLEGKSDQTRSRLKSREQSEFIAANRERILEVFTGRCHDVAGKEIITPLVKTCTVEEMLEMLCNGFRPVEVAEKITEIVLSRLLVPSRPLPSSLACAAGPELTLLNRVWQADELSGSDFLGIEPGNMTRIFRYLVSGPWRDKPWLAEILQTYDTIFGQLAASSRTRKEVEKILVTFLRRDRTYKKTASVIAAAAIRLQRGEDLLTARITAEQLIEDGLAAGVFSRKELTTLAKWVRKQSARVGTSPFMNAFFLPEKGVEKEVSATPAARSLLLDFLVQYHRLDDEELARIGFTNEERSATGGAPSMLSRIGGLFGKNNT